MITMNVELEDQFIQQLNSVIDEIANDYLGIATLQTRCSDKLDFHSVAVWNVKRALRDAYIAGRQSYRETMRKK
jgi:hypothetical protein